MGMLGFGSSRCWGRAIPQQQTSKRPWTFTGWIKVPEGFAGSAAGTGAIVSILGNNVSMCIGASDGSFTAIDNSNSVTVQADTPHTHDGCWHFISGVFRSTRSRTIYSDTATCILGVEETTLRTNSQPFTYLYVGGWRNNVTVNLHATDPSIAFAEVALWNAELSRAEVEQLARGTNPLRLGRSSNILAYYPLRGNLDDLGPERMGLLPVNRVVGGTFLDHRPRWTDHPPVDPTPVTEASRLALFTAAARPLVATGQGSTAPTVGAGLATLSIRAQGSAQAPAPTAQGSGSLRLVAQGAAVAAAPVGSGSARLSLLLGGSAALPPPVGTGAAGQLLVALGAGTTPTPTGAGSAQLKALTEIIATGSGTTQPATGFGRARLVLEGTPERTLRLPAEIRLTRNPAESRSLTLQGEKRTTGGRTP